MNCITRPSLERDDDSYLEEHDPSTIDRIDVCLSLIHISIEGQNRVCTAFCAQQGYEIVDRYIDRATSAFKDTDKRTWYWKD